MVCDNHGVVDWLHCPGGNATDPIWIVLVSSDGISSWTPLKPQHSIPSWLSVQWGPNAYKLCQCCQKKDHQMFVGGFALSGLLGSGRASMLPTGDSVSWSLGRSSRSSFHRRSPEHQELQDLNWSAQPSPCYHDDASTSDILWAPLGKNFEQIFRIFSSSRIIECTVPTLSWNCALIISIDTRRSLSMKFFIWPINTGVLTFLVLPHLPSPLTDSLIHSKTDARLKQDAPKALCSIPYVSVAFFPNLKQNFIAYRSSNMYSRPDWIFEIHQLGQSDLVGCISIPTVAIYLNLKS